MSCLLEEHTNSVLLLVIRCNEISASYSGVAEDSNLLCCYAMSTAKYLPEFRRIVVHSLSELDLNMKQLLSLETSVTTYQSTCCNNPEDLNLRQHRPENPKSRIILDGFLRVYKLFLLFEGRIY